MATENTKPPCQVYAEKALQEGTVATAMQIALIEAWTHGYQAGIDRATELLQGKFKAAASEKKPVAREEAQHGG